MEKSDIEKREEIVDEGRKTFLQILGVFIPAADVAEGLWNFRSRLKERRMMEFLENIQTIYENELGKDLSTYNFETEDFVDVFDSILSKVLSNKSEKKLEYFSNILVNYMLEPSEDRVFLNYVEILERINDVQLLILLHLPQIESGMGAGILFRSVIHKLTGLTESALHEAEKNGFVLNTGTGNSFINSFELELYLNDLASQGLILKEPELKSGHGARLSYPRSKYRYIKSEAGLQFIEFIKLHKQK